MTLTTQIDELMMPHVNVCSGCGAQERTLLGLWGIEHVTDERHRLTEAHECGGECA